MIIYEGVFMVMLSLISKEIEDFFDNAISTDRIDFSKNLSWGYYFSHFEKTNLEIFKNVLLKEGYTFAEIVKEDESDKYLLHLEKIEKHTVDTLTKRDLQLNGYARRFNIDSYEGFDVYSYDII
jgi:hypothetical protein